MRAEQDFAPVSQVAFECPHELRWPTHVDRRAGLGGLPRNDDPQLIFDPLQVLNQAQAGQVLAADRGRDGVEVEGRIFARGVALEPAAAHRSQPQAASVRTTLSSSKRGQL